MISFKHKAEDPAEEKSEHIPIENNDQDQKPKQNLSKFEVTDSDRENYHNLVDILFVLDTTSSMGWCFQEAKNTILDISQMFTKQEFDIRFAICEYRDHPPQDHTFVFRHYDLSNADKMTKVVESLTACGGGDGPEAAMDGLFQGLVKTSWRQDEDGTNSKRFLFHICDAPPHGDQFGGYSCDPQWRKNGCPCKITLQMISTELIERKVIYNLVDCGGLQKMIPQFKEAFGQNFQETIQIDRNQVNQQSSLCLGSPVYLESNKMNKKSSGCMGGGGGGSKSYNKPHQMKECSVMNNLEKKSDTQERQNIFNKQIQSNIRNNLL